LRRKYRIFQAVIHHCIGSRARARISRKPLELPRERFADGKLKKIEPFSGRFAQVLADAAFGRGGAWNRDGVILFTPNAFKGLYRVSSAGGTPVQVTQPDAQRSETSHRWPYFLPDGRHFLYLAANFAGDIDKNAIFVGSLDSAEKTLVLKASSNAVYAEPGFLFYWRDNALVAQRFDARTLKLSGDPRALLNDLQYFPQTDLALFDASPAMLVAQTGQGAARSQFAWFDRNGKQLQQIGSPGLFSNVNLSPDGRRVALEQVDTDGRHVNVWIRDLVTDAATRLGFGSGLEQLAIWSPDNRRVVFASNRGLHFALYLRNADGSGEEQKLSDTGAYEQGAWDWSRDGKYLLFRLDDDLSYLSLADGKIHPMLSGRGSVRNAQFSPDGKWFAYSSNETGNWEIYVSPFPNPTSRWQVSRAGGEEPRWRRDGKELFFLTPDHHLMAVPVNSSTTFEAGAPITLFQVHSRQPISALDFFSYDVSADGQKFFIDTKIDDPQTTPPSIILNWAAELQR